MSVCLTKKQARFMKYISEYKDRTGFYPGPAEAAKEMNTNPGNITALYGSIFLRGGFTNGKGQTRYHADAHYRSELFKERATKARNARKPAKNKIDKQKIALALIKLLSGEDAQKELLSLNDAEDNKMFDLFRQLAG